MHVQTDFNIFFVIFGAVQIVLSHVPKGSRLAMTAAFSVLVIGYTVGSVGLLCKELKGSLPNYCPTVVLCLWSIRILMSACAVS